MRKACKGVTVPEHLVIIGASRAGLFAVEGARRAGYAGRITLVGAEPHLPYDRPPLSKEYLTDSGPTPQVPVYRSADALRDKLGVEVRTGTPATALDVETRTVWLGDRALDYSALVIATGTTARRLPATSHLTGVLTLRTVDDARRLRAEFGRRPRTVVVGAGLIGSEVASAAHQLGLPVTVVEPLPVPLVRVVGEQSGKVCAGLHERHGTELVTGVHVTAIRGRDRVEGVDLSDGRTLGADLVVVGIGAEPEIGWLRDSGLQLPNGLLCDATLNVGVPGVYAAGDVVQWYDVAAGRARRFENWTSAAEQGRIAGRNAARPTEPEMYATVPYIWSDQYGSRLQFVGDCEADEIVTVRDREDDETYLALYRTGDRLTGAFGINQPRLVPKLRTVIARGVDFSAAMRECVG
jgi:NADPH-dependent 2,4-dienoyl-CoA reductase/sulfur reductase-like enzyme